MSAAVTFCPEEDNVYFAVLSIKSQQEQRQHQGQHHHHQQQQQPQQPAQAIVRDSISRSDSQRSEHRGILVDRRFQRRKQPPPTRTSQRSSIWSTRRQQQLQLVQSQHPHRGTKPPAAGGRSSSTRSRSVVSAQERRQLSIINATSFTLFMANLLVALAVLVLFSSDFAALTMASGPGSIDEGWLSLSIGYSSACHPELSSGCHRDQSTFHAAEEDPIGPLECSSWSKSAVHCRSGLQGPVYRVVAGSRDQIEILQTGYYRMHMTVTSCSKGKEVQFAIRVNQKDWAACHARNISESNGSNAYTRCFSNAVRFLRAQDTVDFKCTFNSSSRCCINTFDRLTHFGLERLGGPLGQ